MYKTILMYADQFSGFERRLEVAAALAQEYGAHLIGTAASGGAQLDYIVYGVAALTPLLQFDYEPMRKAAQEQLRQFDGHCRRLGVASYETRFQDSHAADALILQSLYCDLIVTGQSDLSDPGLIWSTRLPGYLAMHSPRPLLVIPDGDGPVAVPGRSIVIGWNASPEASRAVAGAMPLLLRAQRVQIMVLNPHVGKQHGDEPGADLARYLLRHGIPVEVNCHDNVTESATTLCSRALNSGADLIVAGAYGRSRFHEWILGGTTHSLLSQSRVPLLLSH
ncbi:universal stress protein [Janthinobacterium sp. BJB304]|jgi:nucleotide-binding universal stress UspA family protein|uniref:universal stress protein n=1 Tax=Janthinobacterium sp. BJB304 TaxID=1572871 RepID=UPI0015D4803B|nr:universal stress protein [Janthinobacterium sp. BJB304]